jgi:ABC-type branched-subunit amino acid transport system ATPase component
MIVPDAHCKSAVFFCPTLVLLDEPSVGLAPIIVQDIFEMKH